MRRPEDRLQAAMIEFLTAALPADAMVWATPNGGGRSKAEAGILKATGVVAGMPDLFVLHQHRLLPIEVKVAAAPAAPGHPRRRGGVVSQAQTTAHHRLERCGAAPVLIATSLEELEKGLIARGVPLRATTRNAVFPDNGERI
jgi:hypothetical protein